MIYCPDCREEIPVEDFNVSTHVAFCRRCGKNHRYSELADFEVRAGFRPDRPPRGMRVLPDDGTGEGIVFRYFSHAVWILCFFAVFWCGVTGTLTVAVWCAGNSPWFAKLFMIPFQLVGIGFLFGIAMMLFGRSELRFRDGALEMFSGIGRVGRRRRWELADIRKVAVEPTGMQQNGRQVEGVAIVTADGRRRFFGRNLDAEKQQFLVNLIRQKIRLNDSRKSGYWA